MEIKKVLLAVNIKEMKPIMAAQGETAIDIARYSVNDRIWRLSASTTFPCYAPHNADDEDRLFDITTQFTIKM